MLSDNSASAYFNVNWESYQSSVKNNTLYHREMLAALDEFLSAHFKDRPFSFVDVGCGDSSSVASVLVNKPLTKYVGIDAAKEVLKLASNTLTDFSCEKEFIADNMKTAILNLSSPVDIIFTSYAVHHLSSKEKISFIYHCQQKLKPKGFLLMIDGVLEPNQTRDEWLKALEARIKEVNPLTEEEVLNRMQHPRADDFPEEVNTFASIASQQSWKNFEVLVDKGIFAFIMFAK